MYCTIVQVAIKTAIEWLANFFAIGEIMKTADILQDQLVHGINQLIESIPTTEDVEGAFNRIRGTLEDFTWVPSEWHRQRFPRSTAYIGNISPTDKYDYLAY